MLSWEALEPFAMRNGGPVTASFLHIKKFDLRCAAGYVCELPYGRNSDPSDPLVVLAEQRGTCSTKHALIRRLAIEQGYDLALMLGIFEMTDENTPGVGKVLRRYGISGLVEAHCYLRYMNRRIDLTRARSEDRNVEPLEHFLHEEEIDPSQIGEYKVGVHKSFLKRWMTERPDLRRSSLDQLWAIREECIASLST